MKTYSFNPNDLNGFKIDNLPTKSSHVPDLMNWGERNKDQITRFYDYWEGMNDYIDTLYNQYNSTASASTRLQLANEINTLYDNFYNSNEYKVFTRKYFSAPVTNYNKRNVNDSKTKNYAKEIKNNLTTLKNDYNNELLGDDWKSIYNQLDNENIDISMTNDSNKINQYWSNLINQINTMHKKANADGVTEYEKYHILRACQELYHDFISSPQAGKIKLDKSTVSGLNSLLGKTKDSNYIIDTTMKRSNPNTTVDSIINSKVTPKEETPTTPEQPIETPTPETPTEIPTPVEEKRDEFGKVETPVDTVDEKAKALEELNNGIKNGLSKISISMGENGNPVINGRVGYTYDDSKLGIDELKKVINDRLNEALIPFLQSSSFSTAQKINALDNFFINNPNYTNADLYNIVKFKNNLYSDINTITSSNLSDDEKSAKMQDLASQYKAWASNNKDIFPFALSDMWNDFDIDEDLSNRGLLKLAIDTTVDGQELSKALDMYISNKSIYDEAIKNYENMVNSYTPDKLENLGNEYGDIESKYNAQKVDKQATNTALGLGQSNAIATQLGNQAQYQNYAENLAENQMSQTDNVTDYAQNKLDNEYAKVQNAYNNAASAENAVMGEVDKNQADINAYLTKKGVDLATDKYNYERKMQPVQVATNVASSAINAVDKLKNSNNN